ncbi:hypothetical protein [Halocatena pleomorpha]|uniref:Uncharacterized protein n=1 Tax=Halocatena pleomorpha TaxID=1785090 RepID=A0A3P3RGV5_9EURY|nr:hypothetical protein [Halocatena pleomorpha]RRJ32682.1 hypothetical protein EIK79_04285 [Halocatena pleomorpha]
MVKTIRVPEEYHRWLASHKRDDETMGETLRRLTHTPPPAEPIISDKQATETRDAIEKLRKSDRNRLTRVAERFWS